MSKFETIERNGRFYKQEDGRILTENEQLKEWLAIANKHNEELEKEKSMYKGSFEEMSKNYFELKNILNELEEWLKEQGNNGIDEWGNHYSVCSYKLNMLKEKYK